MYSIITKIIHSQEIKDAIAVARGIYRVATSHTYNPTTNAWIEPVKDIPKPID
jgi:hypothetical protein